LRLLRRLFCLVVTVAATTTSQQITSISSHSTAPRPRSALRYPLGDSREGGGGGRRRRTEREEKVTAGKPMQRLCTGTVDYTTVYALEWGLLQA
jgi:hypothetical protein